MCIRDRCHRLRDYDTFSESYKHCKAILKYELYKIHPTDVVLLGPYTCLLYTSIKRVKLEYENADAKLAFLYWKKHYD